MTDTITKRSAAETEMGDKGQKLLTAGANVALRLWDEGEVHGKTPHAHDYETVGYVIEGSATLISGETKLDLRPGDSWHVPAGVEHAYAVDDHLKAIEATSPPARDAG